MEEDIQLAEKLENKRFIFITGKGGVGKTTLSASVGVALANKGKRVLIAMCHEKERISSLLCSSPITDQISQLDTNLWAVNLDPDSALLEYGQMVLKVKSLSTMIFGNGFVNSFLRAVPGMLGWSMLGKAWYHTTERNKDGSNRFDIVILDAPATGHGMEMLQIPKTILEVAPPGILRRDAEKAWKLFQDPFRSGVLVVTLPEEMPISETIEISNKVENDLGLPIIGTVLNQFLEPLFSTDEAEILFSKKEWLDLSSPIKFAKSVILPMVAGARRAAREKLQQELVQKLQHRNNHPLFIIPFIGEQASTKMGIEKISQLIST